MILVTAKKTLACYYYEQSLIKTMITVVLLVVEVHAENVTIWREISNFQLFPITS